MKQLMSNGGVCRTALTKQSLLKMRLKNSPGNTVSVKYISKMFNINKKSSNKNLIVQDWYFTQFQCPFQPNFTPFCCPFQPV